jgi:hypothetical protein
MSPTTYAPLKGIETLQNSLCPINPDSQSVILLRVVEPRRLTIIDLGFTI